MRGLMLFLIEIVSMGRYVRAVDWAPTDLQNVVSTPMPIKLLFYASPGFKPNGLCRADTNWASLAWVEKQINLVMPGLQ